MLYKNFKPLLDPVYRFMGDSAVFIAIVALLFLTIYLIKGIYDKKQWDKHKADPCHSTNTWWSWDEYEKNRKKNGSKTSFNEKRKQLLEGKSVQPDKESSKEQPEEPEEQSSAADQEDQ